MPEYALRLSEAELARYQHMATAAMVTERDLWTAAGVVAGAVIADIGCGPGAVSVLLAQLAGDAGRVIAVDRDPDAVTAARASAARAQVDNLSVHSAPADDTGISPSSVDVVMIRHVLAHNGGLEQSIVNHAASLLHRGGSVYLVDVDVSGFRIRPGDPDIDDLNARYREWHSAQGNDLQIGLRLAELLRAADLEVTEFQGRYQIFPAPPGMRPPAWAGREAMVASGLATADEVEGWARAFDQIDKAVERPVVFMPIFFGIGRRPNTD